jgi:hypothetical protein
MNAIGGRSAALAGAVAVAVLSGTLVPETARAHVYAFGNAKSSSDYATLTLGEGSDPISLSSSGFHDVASGRSTVTSAKSTLYFGTISAELDYSLYGATRAINQLSGGASPNTALYSELGRGVMYGSFVVDSGNSLHSLMFSLNAAAVSGVNAAILGKKTAITISRAAIPIPEPSTWILMLAGFAALGLAAYRRAAGGRAASAAG